MYEHPVLVYHIPIGGLIARLEANFSSPYISPDILVYYTCLLHMGIHIPSQADMYLELPSYICDELLEINGSESTGCNDSDVAEYHHWYDVATRLADTCVNMHRELAPYLGAIPLGIFDTHVLDDVMLARGAVTLIFKMGVPY